MKKLKYLIWIIPVALAAAVVINYPKLDLISGYSAKSVASAHFMDGRSLEMIEAGDNDIKLVDLASNSIDEDGKYAVSSVFGLKKRKAIYRDGLGAVLIDDDFDIHATYLKPIRNLTFTDIPYPYGNAEPTDTLFANVDYKALNDAVANAFDKDGAREKRTRSLVVLYKGRLLAEKYDTGFNKDSRILGWSMTKSICATMFGILEYQKKFNIYAPAPVKEWAGDKRSKITTNDLLHMNSGLEWEEKYDKISDATKMLFTARDMTKSQVDKPLVGAPDKLWNYSSGTSNLLSGILRQQFPTQQQYLDFWYTDLIDRIGMNSMIVETDMAGNYVGSSYAWATTRDWAKFGLLYLNRGDWNGDRIFAESWAKYVSTPTNNSDGLYGGHFWLNTGGKYPDAPRDMYSANGFQGQRVFIIPSMDIVIVRMGLKDGNDFDFNALIKGVIGSIVKDVI
jgi:CubicO group peptidase (beta-lactamase class C family)